MCYIFDLLKVNPFVSSKGLPNTLKQILEDREIIKVFHDFCEDTSALVRQYGVHCDSVFDSQVAHRLLKSIPPQSNLTNSCVTYLGGPVEAKD
jgi:ribonuclease D